MRKSTREPSSAGSSREDRENDRDEKTKRNKSKWRIYFPRIFLRWLNPEWLDSNVHHQSVWCSPCRFSTVTFCRFSKFVRTVQDRITNRCKFSPFLLGSGWILSFGPPKKATLNVVHCCLCGHLLPRIYSCFLGFVAFSFHGTTKSLFFQPLNIIKVTFLTTFYIYEVVLLKKDGFSWNGRTNVTDIKF